MLRVVATIVAVTDTVEASQDPACSDVTAAAAAAVEQCGPARPWRNAALALLLTVSMMLVGGCSSIRVTDPPRTATEQFLLSTSASEAVEQLKVESLQGRKVYIETEYFAASEEKFVLGELRAHLLIAGIQLVPSPDDAQVILEVRSGGVGIDREDFLLGVPSVVLSSSTDSDGGLSVPYRTPEIAFLKNTQQMGFASVAFVAYWKESGEIVAVSGPYIGRSLRDDWWFFGFGPRSLGDIPTIEPVD